MCVCVTLVIGVDFMAGRDLKSLLFQSHLFRLFSEHLGSIFLTKAMDI